MSSFRNWPRLMKRARIGGAPPGVPLLPNRTAHFARNKGGLTFEFPSQALEFAQNPQVTHPEAVRVEMG